MMRNARRKLGELTDTAYQTLDWLAELAEALDDDEIVDWCHDAIDSLEDTLAADGSPTDDTDRLLSELAEGVTDALLRLQPAVEGYPPAYLLAP
jgi:hypothetical protein